MHLFMAREAVDTHLQVAGDLIDPEKPAGAKVKALFRAAGFYAWWYPSRWLGWGRFPRYAEFDTLATHMRFVDRTSRKLARQVFHGMNVHQAKLQHKQGFLFRLVDVADELFAMAAAVSRAEALRRKGEASAAEAANLADLFCRGSRRKVAKLFHDLWRNDDDRKYEAGLAVLDGRHAWLHDGTLVDRRASSRGSRAGLRRRWRFPSARRSAWADAAVLAILPWRLEISGAIAVGEMPTPVARPRRGPSPRRRGRSEPRRPAADARAVSAAPGGELDPGARMRRCRRSARRRCRPIAASATG